MTNILRDTLILFALVVFGIGGLITYFATFMWLATWALLGGWTSAWVYMVLMVLLGAFVTILFTRWNT